VELQDLQEIRAELGAEHTVHGLAGGEGGDSSSRYSGGDYININDFFVKVLIVNLSFYRITSLPDN